MDLNSLIPIIYFHSEETYFPESLDFYIDNSELYQGKNKVLDKAVLSANLDESYTLKNNLVSGDLNRAKLYIRVQELDDFFRIVFFVFFSFNGPLNLFGTCIKIGDHSADVEKFVFFVDKKTLSITKIYLGAHGSKDGLWLTPDDFEKKDNKLIIYSALGSHAFYNKEGTYWRYFGSVNDHTNKGKEWISPQFTIITDEYPEWQKYRGCLGYPDNCNVPKQRGWEDEPEKSTSFLKRFFGCC